MIRTTSDKNILEKESAKTYSKERERSLGGDVMSFLWSISDLLRGDYEQSDYGKVILPFTLLRRLDCALALTKESVLKECRVQNSVDIPIDSILKYRFGLDFFNTSPWDFQKLIGDPTNIKSNLKNYLSGYSENIRDIFIRYDLETQIDRLDRANLLYQVVQKFASIDLHPNGVSNADMGLIFEELIRRFAELSNETAGEHYTPREVIRLMINLLFVNDQDALSKAGIVRTIYDPTAGTGGMLSVAGEHLQNINSDARLVMFGQELNPESYAICKADMLVKGQDIGNIAFGNTLTEDGHCEKHFDYLISNPPFGVDWKKIEKEVREEHGMKGYAGRFGPGLPRVSDGSLLFLLHLISKMKPASEGGSRIAIVLNGSPLFTGGAGSGESDIRKWIIENDYLEAIVALPTDMFYNTGIPTYIWVLTNHKITDRKGKIQLINATELYQKMKKSLGSKRNELGKEHILAITNLYKNFEENDRCKIFDNQQFGYTTITIERPLLGSNGQLQRDKKDQIKVDSSLRDTENVPLGQNIEDYFRREVIPHVPDAWIDYSKNEVGYEIPFNRYFYKIIPPRPLENIDQDLRYETHEIWKLLQGAMG